MKTRQPHGVVRQRAAAAAAINGFAESENCAPTLPFYILHIS